MDSIQPTDSNGEIMLALIPSFLDQLDLLPSIRISTEREEGTDLQTKLRMSSDVKDQPIAEKCDGFWLNSGGAAF